jgi:5-methylthioadenosine/S-adenosylhomocysteine deaminase
MNARTTLVAVLGLLAAGPGCLDDQEGEEVAGETSLAAGGQVVINEFQAGSGGWIELYNPTSMAVVVSGWKVDDIANGGGAPKSVGTVLGLPAGGRLVVSFGAINTASADSVRLLDAAGTEVDSHSNFWAGRSIAGLCFGRSPDGGAWATGSVTCSKGAANPGRGVILRGTVVGPAGPFEGEVRIEGDTLTCVAASCGGAPTVIETNGIILPGMIDTHNHTLFNAFDETDWSPAKAYTNHNQWTNERRYGAMVDAKQWLNGEGSTSPMDLGCELDKYGEIKALIAGTTSVAGAPNPANRACYGSLARTIDQTPNDLGSDKIQMQTVFHGTDYQDGVCENFATGETEAYVVHIGEGTDATALAEFTKLGTITTVDECLYAPQTAIVHGVALGEAQLSTMAAHWMSLIWSPRSNVFLYGRGTDLSKTANIPFAKAQGINIALAPDWSIGGSANLLDELRFADRVDAEQWGNILTPRDLFEMATINAARALGLDEVLGSLEVGKKADLFVLSGDRTRPYDALLAARPENVRLTMVGGTILYGDTDLQGYAPATPGCERLDVCGTAKFLCAAEQGGTTANKFGQTFAEIRTAIAQGLSDYDALNLTEWDFAPIAPLAVCR